MLRKALKISRPLPLVSGEAHLCGAHIFCKIRAGARIFRGIRIFCYTGFCWHIKCYPNFKSQWYNTVIPSHISTSMQATNKIFEQVVIYQSESAYINHEPLILHTSIFFTCPKNILFVTHLN